MFYIKINTDNEELCITGQKGSLYSNTMIKIKCEDNDPDIGKLLG